MKVKLFSDLHLDQHCEYFTFNPGSGELLILAGDILCAKHFKTDGDLNKIYKSFLNYCSSNFKNVLYVLGNHEYYGYNYESTLKTISENLPNNITILNNSSKKIEDWVFIGGTLWTDHNKENPINMIHNSMAMNDYRAIRIGSNFRKLRSEDTVKFYKETKKYFEGELEKHKNEKVFMISHMAPSFMSIHPHYRDSNYNSAYCTDMNEWICDRPQIKYWAHGHIHYPQNYKINECRVIANPRGYSMEKTNFDSEFELEL